MLLGCQEVSGITMEDEGRDHLQGVSGMLSFGLSAPPSVLWYMHNLGASGWRWNSGPGTAGSSLASTLRQESWETGKSSDLRGLGTLADRLIISYLKGIKYALSE